MRYAAILLIVISILFIIFPNYFSGREGLVSQDSDDWELIVRQSGGANQLWYDVRNTGEYNVGSPDADNYCILNQLENYRQNGVFTMKLVWSDCISSCQDTVTKPQIWQQTSNPWTNKTLYPTDYKPINISYTGADWHGLAWDAAEVTILRGSIYDKWWWYAVGCWTDYGGGIPGPYPAIVKKVELYVKKAPQQAKTEAPESMQKKGKMSHPFPPAGYYCPEGCETCKCRGSGEGLDSCGKLCCEASRYWASQGGTQCFKKCPTGQTSKGGGVDWDKCYPVAAVPTPSTGNTHCFGSVCVTEEQVQAAKARAASPQEVWGVNSSGAIYKRPGDGSGEWSEVESTDLGPHPLKDISVGSQYIWGVDSKDYVFKCKKPCTGVGHEHNWQMGLGPKEEGLKQLDAY